MRWTWGSGCTALLMLGMLLVTSPAATSSVDWTALFAGDMVVEAVKRPDGIPGLRAAFAVAAPRERIWAVLLDYANFLKIFPDIHDMRVLTQDQQGAQVEYWVNAIVSKYHYVLYRHYDEPGRRLSWTRVTGDLKRMEGSWEIHETPRSDVHMLVYESYIDIGGVIPKALVRMEARRKVREMGADGGPGGQVLQHEHAVDQVEVAVREHPEVGIVVEDELAVGVGRVQFPGCGDHGRRDVEPVAVPEVGRERARQPADPTAEVEGALAPGRIAEALHVHR